MKKYRLPGFLSIYTFLLFSGCVTTRSSLEQYAVVQDAPFVVITEVDTATAEIVEDTSSTISAALSGMVDSAEVLCAEARYAEADSILKDVIRIVGNKNAEADFPDSECVSRIAKIYAEVMPPNLPVPEEIAIMVFQRQMFRSLDSIKLLPSDSIDLEKIICRKDIVYDVPVVWNERVQRAVHYYLSSRKTTINNWISRSAFYLPFMQKMFADSGLPSDLAFLPLIESGFNPKAYSRAHASGIWQFISSTGKIYGLRNNYWLDERRDPIKSTVAAIRYLKKLYRDFGDWHLALAAYNCGEGGLRRAMVKCSTTDYWSLTLPSETMNYVPLYLAALTIAKNPDCFGYAKSVIDTFSFDTVSVNECLDMKEIAEGIGVPLDTIIKINPHILHWCTPPDLSDVSLYLPRGYKENFKTFLANFPEEKKVKWYRYTIRRGDNLGAIARKFGVPIEPIRTVNRLKGNRIVAGKHLFIPIPAKGADEQILKKLEYKEDEAEKIVESADKNKIRYMVKQGDTLWRLSELFSVTVEDIRRWNNLSDNAAIRAGQILTIYRTSKNGSVSEPVSENGMYEVKRGDTPSSIARQFNISIDKLIELNDLDPQKPVIFAGKKLVVAEKQESRQVQNPLPESPRKERVPADTISGNYIRYEVSKGDNLYRISQNFSIPLESLLSANNLDENAVIRVGDILLVPRTGDNKNERNEVQQVLFYRVKEGDNLWRIATSHGVPVEKLYEYNGLSPDSVLMPGDTIKIIKAGEK